MTIWRRWQKKCGDFGFIPFFKKNIMATPRSSSSTLQTGSPRAQGALEVAFDSKAPTKGSREGRRAVAASGNPFTAGQGRRAVTHRRIPTSRLPVNRGWGGTAASYSVVAASWAAEHVGLSVSRIRDRPTPCPTSEPRGGHAPQQHPPGRFRYRVSTLYPDRCR